jgi:hypothetical protein
MSDLKLNSYTIPKAVLEVVMLALSQVRPHDEQDDAVLCSAQLELQNVIVEQEAVALCVPSANQLGYRDPSLSDLDQLKKDHHILRSALYEQLGPALVNGKDFWSVSDLELMHGLYLRLSRLTEQVNRQTKEIEYLRRYGNKDCTARADAAMVAEHVREP